MPVVVVSKPSRKRENLVTMLESIEIANPIKTVDSCGDALSMIDSDEPVTIFVDYREPDEHLQKDVSSLVLNQAVNHMVLLQMRNSPSTHFTHYTTSEVVFDDLSVGLLSHLLVNIHRNTQV